MMDKVSIHRILLALAVLFILGACSGGSSTPVGPAGEVAREEDIVEHGTSQDALSQLLGSKDLYSGDFLQVHDGGVGRLDFGDAMVLRVLNDTSLREIRSVAAEGSPIDVQMYLEEGGFTGRLTENGGRALFTTPGGAQISVLGTEFFVIHDADRNLTVAGNFGGSVKISSGGSSEFINPGFYVKAPSGGPPGLQEPLPVTLSEFEQNAIAFDSPIIAFDAVDQGCINDSELVQDVTVPSGAAFEPGESFTKSWQIRNSGSCSWGNGYRLEPAGGEAMTDARQIPIGEAVGPGGLYTMSVDMVAPSDPGRYTGQWQLRNPEGERFGEQFAADISVLDSTGVFVAEAHTEDGSAVPKSTFTPGDPIEFVVVVENNSGGSAEIELTFELGDPNGQVVELWRGAVTSTPGRRPWTLSRTVSPDTVGNNTFTGRGSYGGAVTQATADYQVVGPSLTPTVTPSLAPPSASELTAQAQLTAQAELTARAQLTAQAELTAVAGLTAQAACNISFAIAAVTPGQSVTIQTFNFPGNRTFTVTEGAMGTQGINGIVVGSLNSGQGGTFMATFPIPAELAASNQIAIRAQATQGAPPCAAHNWFYNVVATVTPTGTSTITPAPTSSATLTPTP